MNLPPFITPLFGLPVHYRDEHLLVLEKPPGLLMHRTHPRPQISLLEMVRREFFNHPTRIDVCHRLDRETSGLVALGMNRDASRHLSRQFESRRTVKTYEALVCGEMALNQGTIQEPNGRLIGGPVRKMQQVGEGAEKPKAAITHYRVLARKNGYTRVSIALETGRQHQIRVHLAHLGHPIVGDKLYGPDPHWHLRFRETGWSPEMAAALTLPRHALHAAGLTVYHPVSDTPIRAVAPLADDLHRFWQEI